MTKIRNKFLTTAFLLALGGLQAAAAALITTSLGNTAPGFADGSTPPLLFAGSISEAQSGQPTPFNQACGGDLTENCSTSLSGLAPWSFSYGAIADPILSASLTLGIVDHDSAASGSQVGLFSLDGNSLTGALDTQFETTGGDDGMYNVYTVDLVGLFADLVDGMAAIELDLVGPGLQTALFGGGVSETPFNGAHLIFSTLTIETRDIPVIPIPAAAPLFASALALIGLYRRRVLRNAA